MSSQGMPDTGHDVRHRTPKSSTKRGELLHYRPRGDAEARPSAPRERSIVIRYGGRSFLATPEMAQGFLKRARHVLDSQGSELVALLHQGGPELLFIAEHIPFSVGTAFDHPARSQRNVEG